MEGLGKHLIAELFNCNESHISDSKKVEEIMLMAAKLTKTTVVKHFFHEFMPYGVSGVVVIAESHFTIHTWPEFAYAAVDIFTCGDIDCQIAIDHIKNEFESKKCSIFQFKRGMLPDLNMCEVKLKWRKPENAECIEEK